ncbi:MAG: hypothetical protein VZR57_08145, partial [Sharpea azabuensis]|nr:hypothetical protein [Sharpea azabuensis]
ENLVFISSTTNEEKETFVMKGSTASACEEMHIYIEKDTLQKLGIPSFVVIYSLYHQILYHRGIPFLYQDLLNETQLTVCRKMESIRNRHKMIH